MNREILFRGKRIDNGEWAYGYLGVNYRAEITIETIHTRQEIDPKTIGQYTGLIDKKMNRIFEGDVMEFDAYGLHYKGEVFFDEGAFCVKCNRPTASTFLMIALLHDAVCVGNIHDNPELLEGD